MVHHTEHYRIKAPTTFQQSAAASAWAMVKAQCPRNYDRLRTSHQQEYNTSLHIRTLTELLRQLRGKEPTLFNYMLWAHEAMCTDSSHRHRAVRHDG